MKHEYEARFSDLDIPAIRSALQAAGAHQVLPRTLHQRVIFENEQTRATRSWLRLRTNGTRTTLTLKRAEGTTPALESIRELETIVSDLDATREILEQIGLTAVRHQENYREEWQLEDVTCDLDEWPGLPAFLEIEGPSPERVRATAERLGLDFAVATFGSVDELYKEKLGRDILAEHRLAFDTTET